MFFHNQMVCNLLSKTKKFPSLVTQLVPYVVLCIVMCISLGTVGCVVVWVCCVLPDKSSLAATKLPHFVDSLANPQSNSILLQGYLAG